MTMTPEHNISKALDLMNERTDLKGKLSHAENATMAAFVLDENGAWQYAGAYYGVPDNPLAVSATSSVCHGLRMKIAMINNQLDAMGIAAVRETVEVEVKPATDEAA